MQYFTPLEAIIGGALIGAAAALLYLANGRIAGMSGLISGLLPPRDGAAWRIVFMIGLIGATWLASLALPREAVSLPQAPEGWGVPTVVWIAIAGLATGLGTRLANGCTSGHGVCGLARLSKRSAVAVAVFFSVAILTVAITSVV
jgi:uncharacterized membrane protein YedE/YeeE